MKQGYKNEFDFINCINNKKFKELNLLLQDVIKDLYSDIKNEDKIIAYKYGKYAKTDIVINVNGILK